MYAALELSQCCMHDFILCEFSNKILTEWKIIMCVDPTVPVV